MEIHPESKKRSARLDEIAKANRSQSPAYAASGHPASKAVDRKRRILHYFEADENNWNDFHWQMRNRIESVGQLHAIFPLTPNRYEEINTVGQKYRWAISPYYLSLFDVNDILDPIGLMAVPSLLELDESGEADPMDERRTRPAPLVTRRYPDRLILNVTNACGMFCRFCQRKRNIRDQDAVNRDGLDESIEFIRQTPHIRDVLITGGDPLTLPDEYLDMVLGRVRAIPHVEIIRIGSRLPVTIPQRVNDELIAVLRKYHPLYINVHFNHPGEVTADARRACGRLADAGIPLGNQMVLLNGVNNDRDVVLELNRKLLQSRVRPYYIFFAKNIQGATHFNCGIGEGLGIVDFLRGNTSGLAIPTFIVNAPQGYGKVPVLSKNYELDGGMVELTTWESRKIRFRDPESRPISERYERMTE